VTGKVLLKLEILLKMRNLWDIAPCSLVGVDLRFRCAYCLVRVVLEAVRTSETSVYSNETTRRNVPESSYLHRQ
jgi:hypothetical protein